MVYQSYNAEVIADSLSEDGCRLTTLSVTYPRIILAEMNTHRKFSRNTASSRAIPVEKMLAYVEESPFVPTRFPVNKPGMQATEYIGPTDSRFSAAESSWLAARDAAVAQARTLKELGIHKQVTNRLLEPWQWVTSVITATEWANFYNLRDNAAAQPEIQITAIAMREAMNDSKPKLLHPGQWHVPYILPEERAILPWDKLIKLSVARCARVSYLTHGEGKLDLDADFALHDRLRDSGHMSPFEHQAKPYDPAYFEPESNFTGWTQYRKLLPGESVYQG